MSERKLASIRKIINIAPIEGADLICRYTVDGWHVVDSVGKYQLDDLVVYFEIDSWLPTEIAPFLSRDKEPREFMGVKGERLRTVKLRGQLSQGLIMPLSILTNLNVDSFTYDDYLDLTEGDDVTDILGVIKWEAPFNAQLAGMAKGTFPSFIPKTDEERVQNIRKYITEAYFNEDLFEATMKLDGSSITVYHKDGQVGVCSRNMELKLDQEGNTFVLTAKGLQLIDALLSYGKNIAVQGELMGPGVQGNRENLKSHQIYVFNVYDIDSGSYLTPDDRHYVVYNLSNHGFKGKHVPVIDHSFKLYTDNIDELLAISEGPSLSHPIREGVVYKRHDGKFSFKCISNKFLLKEK